jgi:hypothetical protein
MESKRNEYGETANEVHVGKVALVLFAVTYVIVYSFGSLIGVF